MFLKVFQKTEYLPDFYYHEGLSKIFQILDRHSDNKNKKVYLVPPKKRQRKKLKRNPTEILKRLEQKDFHK